MNRTAGVEGARQLLVDCRAPRSLCSAQAAVMAELAKNPANPVGLVGVVSRRELPQQAADFMAHESPPKKQYPYVDPINAVVLRVESKIFSFPRSGDRATLRVPDIRGAGPGPQGDFVEA